MFYSSELFNSCVGEPELLIVGHEKVVSSPTAALGKSYDYRSTFSTEVPAGIVNGDH